MNHLDPRVIVDAKTDDKIFALVYKHYIKYAHTCFSHHYKCWDDKGIELRDNVINDAMIQAVRTYNPSTGAFGTWLAWQIRGKLHNARYKTENPKYNAVTYPIDLAFEVPARPDNTIEDDLADDLYYNACKAGLTPKEMTVYDLLYRLGWSLVLVGKVLGVSDSRIGQHRDQIVKKMRIILAC